MSQFKQLSFKDIEMETNSMVSRTEKRNIQNNCVKMLIWHILS